MKVTIEILKRELVKARKDSKAPYMDMYDSGWEDGRIDALEFAIDTCKQKFKGEK